MFAMQYQITLPADYDMAVIRARVARSGHLLDHYEGLAQKAYLIQEKGVDGATVNQYAPFYLWQDAAAAASFLWSGDGFGGIVRDFGRPRVQTWIGGTYHRGDQHAARPAYAVRSVEPLPAELDPAVAATAIAGHVTARAAEQGVHSAAYGIDPESWAAVVFTLHRARPEVPPGAELFSVLHVSAPDTTQLPATVRRRLAMAR